MKLQWLLRDNPHRYYKRPSDRSRHTRVATDFVYQCAHCKSWINAESYEDGVWLKRHTTNFCARGQGMLFDKIFRLENKS